MSDLKEKRQAPQLEQADSDENVRFAKGGEFIDERGRRVYKTTTPPPPYPSWAKYVPGGYNKKTMLPLKGKKMMWAVKALAGIAILFFGYDQGVMGGVNESSDYKRLMGVDSNPQTDRDAACIGGIVAIYYLGTLLGALGAGIIGDQIGRIKSITIACFFALLGASLQASAKNITWMMFARVITGLGTGVLNCIVPILCSELSSHDTRGATLALEFTVNIAGVALAYWQSFGLQYRSSRSESFSWRFPLAFQVVFILILLACIPLFPESPRWLARMGREDEARYILAQCRTEDGDEDAEIVNQEMYDILEVADLERSYNYSYWQLFTQKDEHNLRRRVWLSVGIQVVQELTGIGAVTAFAPTVFKQAGYSAEKAALISGINDTTYIFSVIIAVFIIDRIGRRKTLFYGSVAMASTLVIACAAAYMVNKSEGAALDRYGALVASMVVLYTASFGATWLTVPWLWPTEAFPSFVRTKGSAASVVGWSVGNGMIMEITPFLFAAIGAATFAFFAGLTILSIPFVYFLLPETANRSLESMDILFSGSILVHNQEKEFAAIRESDPELYHALQIGDKAKIARKRGGLSGPRDFEHRENASEITQV